MSSGIRHNIPFLSALMSHPRWREKKTFHRLHCRGVSKGVFGAGARGKIARRLAAVAAAIDHVLGERSGRFPAR